MIKTVATTAGVNTVTFPEFYKYFWIKNTGGTTVYASAYSNVSAGVDNTCVINSGDAVCIENVDNNSVYISGAGSVEIHAQDIPDCSFKFAPVSGGGGSAQELLLIKQEETAYSETGEYYFTIGNDFNIDDYKMFIFIKSGEGSVIFTPQCFSVYLHGNSNIYQVMWSHTDLFSITNTSGTALSYFGYQLFGVKG